MIFFCYNSGAIFKTVPEKIYQGSVNANTIYLVGAFDGDCAVTVRFELPNGLLIKEKLLASSYTALSGDIKMENGISYNVWEYVLKSDITALSGTVGVQFTITSQNENGMEATVCTARSNFDVERGVPVLQDDSIDNYETLLTQIKAVLTALQNGDTENSIASAASAAAALASEQAAKVSEQAAATSAEAAKTSEENALASEQAAKTSEENAYSVAQSIVVDRKQIAENTLNIHNIQAVLQGNSQYAEITVSEAYTSRVTANGANIFDNQLTPVESIKGNTVRCRNLFEYSRLGSRNNLTVNGDGTITIAANVYSVSTQLTLGYLAPKLKVGDVVTFNFKSDGCQFFEISGVPMIYLSSPTVTITQAHLDGQVVFYGQHPSSDKYGQICTISNIQIEYGTVATAYQPYFTGLKNANINSIVSTGKNLFDIANIEKGSAGNFTVDGNNVLFNPNNITSDIFAFSCWLDVEPNKEYYFSCTSKSISSVYLYTDKLLGTIITFGSLNKALNVGNNSKILVGFYSIGNRRDGTIETITDISISTELLNVYEPYIEHKYQLPQTVELAEFDTIYPEKGEIERFTKTKVFEITQGVWSMPDSGLFLYGGSLDFDVTEPSGQGVCNLFAHNPEQSPIDMTWFLQNGNLYFVNKQISSIADWSSYLADKSNNGDPLTLAYRATTATKENINAPITYEADNGGTETINQGETDNSEYGAMPTVTQTYLGKVGE